MFTTGAVYTKLFLHKKTFTQKPFTTNFFHTGKLSHQTVSAPDDLTLETVYTKHLLHQKPFTPNSFYTRTLLQQPAAFAPTAVYTKQRDGQKKILVRASETFWASKYILGGSKNNNGDMIRACEREGRRGGEREGRKEGREGRNGGREEGRKDAVASGRKRRICKLFQGIATLFKSYFQIISRLPP